jgi:hypothetical protein
LRTAEKRKHFCAPSNIFACLITINEEAPSI